jgi:hypothetical protein
MYQAMAEVLDLLWTSVHRWRTLKLNLSEASGHFWSVRPLAKARNLEAIHFSNSIPDFLIEQTIRNFGKLKALRTFSIDGLQVTSSRAMIAYMPLHKLTRLDVLLHGASLVDGLNVLRECVSATWIRVDSLGDPDSDTLKDVKAVELPRLKVLELAGMRCHATELLFLHCPNLEVLSISSGPTSTFRTIISEFISDRQHSLRVLRVSELLFEQLGPFFDNPDLIQIPVVEVGMLNVGGRSLEQARFALENCGIAKKVGGNLRVLDCCDERVNSGPIMGWADRALLTELDGYFSHEWTTPLNSELFHS